jgi:ABC-type Fe3+-hydroxamate transport system substrate-binding protein
MLRDARGREFQTGEYGRIVSLVPSWTESLFALGAGPRVLAVTDYCVEPTAEVAHVDKIGGTKNPRIEEILAFHPDLVIANVEENRKSDVERLEAQGVPVFVTDARTVAQGINELKRLARLVGAKNLAAVLAPIEREYEAVQAARAVRRHPRVFVAIWKDPWMTANGGTFIGDMIRVAGGENVFETRARLFPLAADLGEAHARAVSPAHDTRYPRVAVEEVLARAPEVILLPDEPYAFAEKDAVEWRGFCGKVLLLDGKILSWYGVRMGESLRRLRKLLND